ncbi:hypothetical protein GUJ93_ZPchr0001g31011 [Zizania palustris]|uniref:Uncharacterized protein n=1 Tax=Zizania palustris TaxID=103762 RepID=A0A8J5RE03_ZIZPA|nr:hypothetical protein GUJ93_ZPchr0001g31011 [Zizania palustris]
MEVRVELSQAISFLSRAGRDDACHGGRAGQGDDDGDGGKLLASVRRLLLLFGLVQDDATGDKEEHGQFPKHWLIVFRFSAFLLSNMDRVRILLLPNIANDLIANLLAPWLAGKYLVQSLIWCKRAIK